MKKPNRDEGYLRVTIQMTPDDQMPLFQDPNTVSFLISTPEEVRDYGIIRTNLFNGNGELDHPPKKESVWLAFSEAIGKVVRGYRERKQ